MDQRRRCSEAGDLETFSSAGTPTACRRSLYAGQIVNGEWALLNSVDEPPQSVPGGDDLDDAARVEAGRHETGDHRQKQRLVIRIEREIDEDIRRRERPRRHGVYFLRGPRTRVERPSVDTQNRQLIDT